MAWVKFEDDFFTHPKVAPLSDGAFRLWVQSIAYSNRHGLDGYIPKASLRQFSSTVRGRMRCVNELIAAGLWHDGDTNATRTRHERDTNATRTRHERDTNATRRRHVLDCSRHP